MIWLGAAALVWFASAITSGVTLIALEMFDGPPGGYLNMSVPNWVLLLAPLAGAVALVPAHMANAKKPLLTVIACAPLAIQAAIFLIFIRTGAMA